MALHVEVVVPDREIWSGSATMVVAKTLDGDIGILASHPPVLGILAAGSVVRIIGAESAGEDAGAAGGTLAAAVSSGFLSVADDRVSVLARSAELGSDVDVPAARSELGDASPDGAGADEEDRAAAAYARARLRAAGEQA